VAASLLCLTLDLTFGGNARFLIRSPSRLVS
jgi:hypothetical protein